MRKHVLIAALLCASLTLAQQGINYKALIKDANDAVVANQSITVQFSILQGVAQTNVYQETHTPTTDANGIIIINIGEGTVDSGVFNDINWASDDHFLNTQINTGSGLVDMGTTGFKTVPYALSAKTAANVTGLETIDEGNGNGLVKVGRVAANYGNIGAGAFDVSTSGTASSTLGATGALSTATGFETTASGDLSTAMGNNTTASGFGALATGFQTTASGDSSTAIGNSTTASNLWTTAMGFGSTASGSVATAMGFQTQAIGGSSSTAMGNGTVASGLTSTAMGLSTEASGDTSTAMGVGAEASGNFSTAMGFGTRAEAQNSVALGYYNVGGGNATTTVSTDPVFEIGNGTNIAPSNALTVLKNGTITAPSFDIAEITDDKALITKEYAEANLEGSGLETIDEGKGNGLVKIGRNPVNYGSVGLGAVDMSSSSFPSQDKGATGDYSMAIGKETEASGNYSMATGLETEASGVRSTAMGFFTIASGSNSTALGYRTTASGYSSTAMGDDTTASGDYSTAMGLLTISEARSNLAIGEYNVGGGNPTSVVVTDPVFEIGNGTGTANRSNALTVLKNGTITAPSFDISEITDAKALITKEYLEANGFISSGLESIDEGNGNGLVIVGRDSNNYGNIGLHAVDLSFSNTTSIILGATGESSFSIGSNTSASGFISTAIGRSTIASGAYSLSTGNETEASGERSTAMGRGTMASGNVSLAFGFYTVASGVRSTAMGSNTTASGERSTAMGNGTKAEAHSTTSIGSYNVGGGNPSSIVSTDPIFEIGNGTNDANRNNALTVLKNGNIGIGTSLPSRELDVNGSAMISGNITATGRIYGERVAFSGYTATDFTIVSAQPNYFATFDDVTDTFNVSANGTFTAPRTGLYFFSTSITFSEGDGMDDTMQLGFSVNSGTTLLSQITVNPRALTSAGVEHTNSHTMVLSLNSGYTVNVLLKGISATSPVEIKDRTFTGYYLGD